MDRPSQEPGRLPEATESPLSFPVEAPRLEGVEPGGGAPLSAAEPAPAPLAVPEEGRPPADPLAFPVEVTAPADAPGSRGEVSRPPAFSPEAAPPPADPPAFPSAAAAPPGQAFPSAATAPPGYPLQPPPSADPPAFPSVATTPPAEALPFPVAHLPGAPASQPAAGAPEPAPVPHPTPAPGLPRFLAPVLTTIAALMAVGGSFLPLFRLQPPAGVRQFFDSQLSVAETVWGSRVDVPGHESVDQTTSLIGVPLVVAIVVLFAAAFLAFSRPEGGLGRWLTGAGAVFTAGVVFTIGMTGLGWSATADRAAVEVVTAVGMWLLIGAAVLAAAGAVVAYLPGRREARDWADPGLAYADTPTPPTGVAITVLPPDPDERHE